MNTPSPKPRKIDKRLQGEPIQAGGRTVEPVARLSGFIGWGGGEDGSGGGGWLKLTPQEVIVRDAKGAEQRLDLNDPTAIALRGVAMAGMAVAVVSWLVMILAWMLRSRRSAGE